MLPAFEAIVPCGIQGTGKGVTSLEAEIAKGVSQPQVRHHVDEQGVSPPSSELFCRQMQGGEFPITCESPQDIARSGLGDVHSSCTDVVCGQDESRLNESTPVARVAEFMQRDFAHHFGYQNVELQLSLPDFGMRSA